ncbi:hypothetical protein Aab01nite_08770 [Paractinoplanes abujensis]|nr:hypothetical protein Aab01nite_08770 [Actinoplanes abujensis]
MAATGGSFRRAELERLGGAGGEVLRGREALRAPGCGALRGREALGAPGCEALRDVEALGERADWSAVEVGVAEGA